ncbi:hypothetical protein SAMN05421847_2850 [Halpernia humi]|uniref:DUF5666 domain-containing protein n=1 Tax=Halpernia humi TaxID=493375 RepID=A0A1H6BEQ4_9FLAO|nr:hypothetical protein [Halpernia humi]SEG59259.1 hypothetical protein SAMN05421847_2850 [Halpernia humi]
MKRIFIQFTLLVATFSYAQTQTKVENVQQTSQNSQKIILPEGTLVKASLKSEIRGGSMKVGDQVELILNQPLVVGDQVVVAPGAKVMGTVTEARASGVLGRKGKLGFSLDYLYLDNGQVIKLIGQTSKNLKGSGVIVGVATAVNPLGLLIPGKGAKYKAGTVFEAYIAKDTELRK